MENFNTTSVEICTPPFDIKTYQPYLWIFALKAVIALVIIVENVIVFLAIIQKWKTLVRQQNLYRYVLSLVAADLLNGFILIFYSLFWIVAISKGISFDKENTSETFRNLITGVLFGLTFASLSSAALLNLVLRVTSTRALARAAAIQSRAGSCINRGSWVRSPRITITLIMIIWISTLAFVVIPLRVHCDGKIEHCVKETEKNVWEYFAKGENHSEEDPENCSILQTPVRRTYLIVLNSFITFAWVLMIICNIFTTCIKTEVQKSPIVVDGKSNLKLTRSIGFSKDTSSIFALIISLSMTLSTLPFVIFTFVTEEDTPFNRVHYGVTIDRVGVELIEMTTYISSIVNPFIYTAMLSRLRSDIMRILKWHKPKGKTIVKLQHGNNNTSSL